MTQVSRSTDEALRSTETARGVAERGQFDADAPLVWIQPAMTQPSDPPDPFDGSKLFGALDGPGRRRLMSAAERVRFGAGDVILREGDESDAMFVVLQGELRVSAQRLGGDPADIGPLGPGAVFGEIGVLTGEPRTATITAVTEAWVMRLGSDPVREVMNDYPGITGDLMRLGLQRSEATLAEVMRDEVEGVPGEPD